MHGANGRFHTEGALGEGFVGIRGRGRASRAGVELAVGARGRRAAVAAVVVVSRLTIISSFSRFASATSFITVTSSGCGVGRGTQGARVRAAGGGGVGGVASFLPPVRS